MNKSTYRAWTLCAFILALFLAAASSAAAKGSLVVTRSSEFALGRGYADGQTLCLLALFDVANVGDGPGTLQGFSAAVSSNNKDVVICIDDKSYPTIQAAPSGTILGAGGIVSGVSVVIPAGATIKVGVRATVSAVLHSTWVGGISIESDVPNSSKVTDTVYNFVADMILKEGTANCSLRAQVTPTYSPIMGFVVRGDSGLAYPYLIRVSGPGLGMLGVGGTLSNPTLTVYDSKGKVIATNDNWAGLETAFTQVGAFPFSTGSTDAAVLLWLPPGNYTVIAHSAVAGESGEVLFEQYSLPGNVKTSG